MRGHPLPVQFFYNKCITLIFVITISPDDLPRLARVLSVELLLLNNLLNHTFQPLRSRSANERIGGSAGSELVDVWVGRSAIQSVGRTVGRLTGRSVGRSFGWPVERLVVVCLPSAYNIRPIIILSELLDARTSPRRSVCLSPSAPATSPRLPVSHGTGDHGARTDNCDRLIRSVNLKMLPVSVNRHNLNLRHRRAESLIRRRRRQLRLEFNHLRRRGKKSISVFISSHLYFGSSARREKAAITVNLHGAFIQDSAVAGNMS